MRLCVCLHMRAAMVLTMYDFVDMSVTLEYPLLNALLVRAMPAGLHDRDDWELP